MENDQSQNTVVIGDSNLEPQPQPIAEFVSRPDFPQCVLGRFVEIGGYAGVVTDILHNSLKIRSPEETTKSFNFHTLRKLYGPREELEPMISMDHAEPAKENADEVAKPKRNVITEPDFTQPVKAITEFIGRADFPQCTMGQQVDINGYTGVVVEIVNRSLKVRSPQETTKSFNADALTRLFKTP